jgi:DNA-binding transcriptional LysR family regulator
MSSSDQPSSASPPTASWLTIGYVRGVTLAKWRRIWAERFPRVPLDVVDVPVAEQREALDAGRVDMCFVRLPIERDGLHAIPLYEEIPVVVAPKDHPLAAYESVSLADLVGETWVDADAEDAADRVAWGQGLLHVPLSVARTYSRKDLIHRPITDAPTTTIALAWLADNNNPLIEEFVGIVRGRRLDSSRTAQARAASGREVPKDAAGPAKPAPKASAPGRRPGPPRRPAPRRRGR